MRGCSLVTAAAFLSLGSIVSAADVWFNHSIDWVKANPDGLFDRTVVGVNGAWPPPSLNVTKGDRILMNVTNNLGNVSTSIHFHGLFQNGTTYMDGPPSVTQCPIPAGSWMLYNFSLADQVGTYWYHSHVDGQYPQGLRAPFIIYDPDHPYIDEYDEEIVLTMSDWYHDFISDLTESFIYYGNPTGAEPIPDSNLINDGQSPSGIQLEPNKTYMFRIVNIGAFVSQYFWIEGHSMKIVEVDGVYTEAADTDMLYITVAQRYSVLVTTDADPSVNYPIVASFDLDMLDTLPDTLEYNATNWIVYNDTAELPEAELIDEFDEYDDFDLSLVNPEDMIPDDAVAQVVQVNVSMNNLMDGANYAFFNNISYKAPDVPTLFTVLSAPDDVYNDSTIYGGHTDTFVLEHNQAIEIQMNNFDAGKHPFHLHGHNFQVVERSEGSDDDFIIFDSNNPGPRRAQPMKRDTIYVKPQGYVVLRFISDNPGVWFFHCHIEWHMEQGLALVLVEAPDVLRAQTVIPQNHLDNCIAGGMPYVGNAANRSGTTEDWLDLTGEPAPPKDLPGGFTARGIVAMVFSCISAFLGMAAITWYGLSDLQNTKKMIQYKVAEQLGPDEILADSELPIAPEVEAYLESEKHQDFSEEARSISSGASNSANTHSRSSS